MFRIDGLEDARIWELGDEHVARPSQRTIYGRGDILQGEVERVGLRLDHNNIPPRHANIEGWPADKDEKMMLAKELAAAASLKERI